MRSTRLDTAAGAIPIESAAAFIASLEAALAEGNHAFVRRHLPALQDLLDRIQREVSDLALLQLRGCCVRDDCQSPAGEPTAGD